MSSLTMSWLRSAFGAIALALGLAVSTVVTQGAEVTYALRIESGRVPENMRLIRVMQDDVVRLQWSADKPSIVHLHGYDIEKRVEPDAVAEMNFTARATGRFPLHAHASDVSKTDEEAALLYVEVYPR